ncbi:hypothetical protein MHYP_G00162460 [Metynnis hypsauchen]
MILEEEGLYVPTLGRRVKGIVPLEMALCLKVFIQSKYFTLEELNRSIKEFPYKWSDKADAPQLVPVNFAARKSVGGNGHENWTLLRLLPLMVGSKIPEGDPTWEVILVLKDIVELANNTADGRREAAIRCLVVYLGEKEDDLFKEYNDTHDFEENLKMEMMKICIVGNRATIVVEGTKVLEGSDLARSCALLMGVIYALNLSYPKQLKFTFEVFQKLFLDLDAQKTSTKVMNLKYSIF